MKKNTDQKTLLKDNVIQTLERTGQLNEDIEKELDTINNKLIYLIENVQAGIIDNIAPKTEVIKQGEHIVYHTLLSDAKKVFSTLYGQSEVTTRQELQERREIFEKHIKPVISQYTKQIYSLIK